MPITPTFDQESLTTPKIRTLLAENQATLDTQRQELAALQAVMADLELEQAQLTQLLAHREQTEDIDVRRATVINRFATDIPAMKTSTDPVAAALPRIFERIIGDNKARQMLGGLLEEDFDQVYRGFNNRIQLRHANSARVILMVTPSGYMTLLSLGKLKTQINLPPLYREYLITHATAQIDDRNLNLAIMSDDGFTARPMVLHYEDSVAYFQPFSPSGPLYEQLRALTVQVLNEGRLYLGDTEVGRS